MSFTVAARTRPTYLAYVDGLADALRNEPPGSVRLLTFREYVVTMRRLERLRRSDPGGDVRL